MVQPLSGLAQKCPVTVGLAMLNPRLFKLVPSEDGWRLDIFEAQSEALFGLRRQSGGRRSHAATALWLRSPTKALDEVVCLTIQPKAASRFACRRSPKDSFPLEDTLRSLETGMQKRSA